MQTSTKRTLKYISENLKHNKRLFLILSFLMGIGLIMASGSVSAASHLRTGNDMRDIFEGTAVIGLIIFILSTVVYIISAPIQMFSYNLVRSKTDMVYSLPIKKNKRFLADLFGGLISVIIPYILFGIIASAVLSVSVNWSSFYIHIENTPRLMFTTFIFGLLILIMAYLIVSLVCQFTGTVIDAITFTVLTIAEVPIGILAVSSLAEQYSNYMLTAGTYPAAFYGTNPVGLLIFTYMRFSSMTSDNDSTFSDSIMFPTWFLLLTSVISIIVIFALAYLVQKFRKAEDTGKSITCEPVFHIEMVVISIIW